MAGRLEAWFREEGGLSSGQFGFRPALSSCDAILRIREIVGGHTSPGRMCVAVSLDVRNAFNTLSWPAIRAVLRGWNIPTYLQAVLDDYFSDRHVVYPFRDGRVRSHKVTCGVPQGSVLGPLLWDVGCDAVLGIGLLPLSSVVCYADDTLVLSASKNGQEAAQRASEAVAWVSRHIATLGLQLAARKTEALVFRSPSGRPGGGCGGRNTRTNTVQHQVPGLDAGRGVVLRDPFRVRLGEGAQGDRGVEAATPEPRGSPRARQVALLSRRALRTNVRCIGVARRAGGPGCGPVCRGAALSCGKNRTVALEAVRVLARVPPAELFAWQQAEVFREVRELRRHGAAVLPEAEDVLRSHKRRELVRRWSERLDRAEWGRRVLGAIRSVLDW